LAYAGFLNQLEPDFVKLHHLHVVRGTQLAKSYETNPFPVYEFKQWVEFLCDFLERLKSEIVVQRLFGWAPDDDLIAPRWRKSKAEIREAIVAELEKRDSWQGKLASRAVEG
jgi:radical SAM superfamily enzyme